MDIVQRRLGVASGSKEKMEMHRILIKVLSYIYRKSFKVIGNIWAEMQ